MKKTDIVMETIQKQDTDAIILQLLKKIEDKKQQIGEAERPKWETTCVFRFNPAANDSINIQVVREIQTLVEIYAFLMVKEHSFEDAKGFLGLDEKEVVGTWQGFAFNQWYKDIETRANILRIKVKQEELAKLESRVNALVSPEQRRAIELAKLMKEIK